MINSSYSTLTPDERREEANRIIKILVEMDYNPDEGSREEDFLNQMTEFNRPVSEKQLDWLRRIKDKAC